MMRSLFWTAVVALVLVSPPLWADYDAGRKAWDAGNPAQALSEWRKAANAGDRRAMLALGRLYVQGLGAPRDYVLAYMWFNLAAGRGETGAVKERDAIEAKLTPAERAEAQKRARTWRPGTGTTAAAEAPAVQSSAADAAAGPPPPRAIREAQELLGSLGYAPGPADGVWGNRTGKAYRAFLRDAGLPAEGTLTPQALRAMRAAAKRQGGDAATDRGTTATREEPRQPEASRPASVRPDAALRAAVAGDIEGLKAALAAGADVNARDSRGWTALMHAASKGYVLLVEPLLAAEADPDIRSADGATALYMAAVHWHTEVVVLLMEADVDISIKGPKGKTAVDVARLKYGDLKTLREKGEDPAVIALVQGVTLSELRARAEERKRLRERVGKVFRDCEGCPEMVVVSAGSFEMGSPSSEAGRDGDEGPVRRVTIGERFVVGVKEVTRGEYGRFVRATGHSAGDSCWTYEDGELKDRGGRNWEDPGFGQTDEHPVVCVNWEDAQAYVRWLRERTGKGYRLLSESEWEYVARGGSGTAWYWGEDGQCRYANGGDRSVKGRYSDWKGEIASCDDGHVHTAPVGSFAPNGFGLYDVLGNVWEWVEDCWNDSYHGAPSDGRAWETGDCGRRVLRGGSWIDDPRFLRSAYRLRFTSGNRDYSLGFRVARTLTP